MELLGQSYKNVKSKFLELDHFLEVDDCGFTSYKFGLGIYVSNSESYASIVEGVIVFKKRIL